jgi:hypothetical protein
MSQNKPTYIYESPDGGTTVYARPIGADPADRFVVPNGDGWSLPNTPYQREMIRLRNEQELARGMFELARSNESLREALDHAIMIYNLIKNDHGSIKHTK